MRSKVLMGLSAQPHPRNLPIPEFRGIVFTVLPRVWQFVFQKSKESLEFITTCLSMSSAPLYPGQTTESTTPTHSHERVE